MCQHPSYVGGPELGHWGSSLGGAHKSGVEGAAGHKGDLWMLICVPWVCGHARLLWGPWWEALLSPCKGRSAQLLGSASCAVQAAGGSFPDTAPGSLHQSSSRMCCFSWMSLHHSGCFSLQRSSAAEEWPVWKEIPVTCHKWGVDVFCAGSYLIGTELSGGDECNMS